MTSVPNTIIIIDKIFNSTFMLEASGTFMKVGVRNNNGRIYTTEAMTDAFKEYQERVERGEAFGTFTDISHPEDNFYETKLSRVTHKVKEVEWNNENGEVFGKIELLDTPDGKIAQEMMKATGSLDIAPTMLIDNTSEDGVIDNVLKLESFDICKESAWPDAKVKPTTNIK